MGFTPDAPSDASPSTCGNFITETGETCDDGNQVSNDGCNLHCFVEGTCVLPLNYNSIATRNANGDLSFSADNLSSPDFIHGLCSRLAGGHEMVFAYTPEADGLLVVDTIGSHYDTLLYARTTCFDSASEFACNNEGGGGDGGPARMVLVVRRDEPIFIIVDGYDDDRGVFFLNMHLSPTGVVGDACEADGSGKVCGPSLVCAPSAGGAHTCQTEVDVGCGVGVRVYDLEIVDRSATASGTTLGTQNRLTGSCIEDAHGDNEVVYRFTMPVDGTFEVVVADTGFDSFAYVYEGMCGTSEEVLCTVASNFSTLGRREIVAGTDVYFVLDGEYPGAHGEYALRLSISPRASAWEACGSAPTAAHCEEGLACISSRCRP